LTAFTKPACVPSVHEKISNPSQPRHLVFGGCGNPLPLLLLGVRPSEGSGLCRVVVPATRFFSLRFFAVSACLVTFTGVICAADEPHVKPTPAEQAPAAIPPPSDEAQKILAKAQETMANFKTFKADILNTSEANNVKSKTVLYQRNNPDGVMEMRVDSEFEVAKVKHTSAFVTNRDGQWQLTRKTAIKMEFQEAIAMAAQQTMAGVQKGEESPMILSLSETIANGKSYYLIKGVIAEESRQKVKEMLQNNPQFKELLKTLPPNSIPIAKLTLFRIGKGDGILYSTQQYDDKGNKMSEIAYENVQINLPLADNIFAIPRELKIKIAKTVADYTSMLAEDLQ